MTSGGAGLGEVTSPASHTLTLASPPPRDLERLTSDLVRIDSTKDPGEALAWIERFCREHRIPVHRHWPSSPHPVLLAGARPGRASRQVLIATHVDTVPQLGTPRRRPGTLSATRLHGRGALDMKAGLALALTLLRDFTPPEPRVPRWGASLSLLVTSDEEGDSLGVCKSVQSGRARADLVLVPEPTWERAATAAYGRRGWDLSFTSPGGHAEGNFQRTTNPVSALASAVAHLPVGCIPVSLSTEGDGEVTLPTVARAKIELVYAKPADATRATRHLSRAMEGTRQRFPGVQGNLMLRSRRTPWPEPYSTPRGNPLVASFLQSVRSVLGNSPVITEEAVGDFNVFGARFPTVIFGPAGGGAHGRDEWVDRRSLARCWRVYADFLTRLQTYRTLPVEPSERARTLASRLPDQDV